MGVAPLRFPTVWTWSVVDPHAHEELAHHRRDVRRLAPDAEQHDRAVTVCAPLRGEDLAYELVVRLVVAEALAHALVKQIDRLDTDALRVGAQQVAPLRGPVVGVRRA